MVNLSAHVLYHASRTPDRLAIIYEQERISYADLSDRVLRMAGWLQARGVQADQVVAVVMKNSTAFIEIALATSHIGAIFLPINFRLSAAEIDYIASNAEAVILFADEEFGPAVRDNAASVLVNVAAQSDSRMIAGDASMPPMTIRRPEDLFRLMYTSGTTDRPKGVMHTYDNYYWKSLDHIAALSLTADERLLVVGPLYHVGAFDLPGTAVLHLGGMMLIQRNFDEEQVLAAIQNEKLTGGWLAPVMVGRLLSHENASNYNLSSFRWALGGGEKTPEKRILAFSALFNKGRYIDAYGLTETCSGDTMMEAGYEIEKIGSTGRAMPHVAIRICDENGQPVAPGEDGEICLRGPKVTRGYWKEEAKTRQSFFGDWFRTGDVGHLDEDGFLFLTDRKKDMIISGGENIASSEVERVIFMLPAVADVAVIGLPDACWGECVAAVVVLQSGHSLDLPTLTAFCRTHMASFKVPKHLILRELLPRNPSGKVLKRVLRDELADMNLMSSKELA
jgi:fatty-acyl-CoA synthase